MRRRADRRDALGDPALVDQPRRTVVEICELAKTDVQHDDVAAGVTLHEVRALHRAKGEREISDDRAGRFAGDYFGSRREIERDDGGAALASVRDGVRGVRDRTTQRTGGPGAQQGVDHDRFTACHVAGAAPFGDRNVRQRERPLGNGIGRLRTGGLDHAHWDAAGSEGSRDDPSVAAVVSRAGEDDHTAMQAITIPKRDLRRRGGPCTLHERTRRNARRDRCTVTSRRLLARDDGQKITCATFRSCARSSTRRCRCAR